MEWDTSSVILEYLCFTRVLFLSTSTLTWQHVFDEVKTFTPTHLLEAAILMYKNTDYYYTECGAKGRLQLLLHLFIYFGRVLVLLLKVWVSGTSCMSEYILILVRPLSLDSLALLGSVIQKNLFSAS